MAISGKHPLKYAPITTSAAETVLLATPAAGKTIVVCNYTLVIKGVTAVTFKSATTAISGPLDPGAAAVIDTGGTPESPQFACARGEALNLTNSAAVAVGGHVTYIEVD